MSDHRLSKNFTRNEFLRTSYGQFQSDNIKEGMELVGTLTQLAAGIMQRIRDKWGPITITSGYRCKGLNDAVGSNDRSQHLRGEACDFVMRNVPMNDPEKKQEFFDWLKAEYDCGTIAFNQCLEERACIHIALPTGSNDGRIGAWAKGKVTKRKKKNV